MQLTLNSSQQEGYDKILAFLNNPEQNMFILSGGPGTGKSFFINYLMQNLHSAQNTINKLLGRPVEHFEYTATTNSAVDNLTVTGRVGGARTIQSLLGLRVMNGELVPARRVDYTGHVIVIDEYTLIDHKLLKFIEEAGGKIIYVGDSNQLLAVKGLAYKLQNHTPDHILMEPMRTKSPEILETVALFLNLVQGKEPENVAIKESECVQCITFDDFKDLVQNPDSDFSGSRIITHTNADAIEINQAIRQASGLPEHFIAGERVILNKYTQKGRLNFKTDSEYNIIEYLGKSVYSVCDDWGNTFVMDSAFDLRSMYCSTIYKAQGRSFDTIYINLNGFPNNISRSVLTRSLYVAASRARKRIVFIGDLSEKLLEKL